MKNKRNEELAVCGINAVKAVEKNRPESITRLYVSEERAPLFGSLCKVLAARRIPYNAVENTALEKLCGSVHHQGVVAMICMPRVEPVTAEIIDGWARAKETVLVLDNIGNANNFGAIVRSAAFFGVRNIVIEKGQPYITTSSFRVAEGGMEYVCVRAADSIAELLKSARGKITRVGADRRGAVPCAKLFEAARQSAVLVVLGSEERGISRDVRALCDMIVSIAPEEDGFMESLNVAQAASILLYECKRAKA